MHQALYRKWRPQVFDDVYGQEHITSILKYETENNKFSHAYLFKRTGSKTKVKRAINWNLKAKHHRILVGEGFPLPRRMPWFVGGGTPPYGEMLSFCALNFANRWG